MRPELLGNGIALLTIMVLGAGIAATTVASARFQAALPAKQPLLALLDGRASSALEADFKHHLPLLEPSVSLLNSATMVMFGQARKEVQVGRDGWLFTSEEYDWRPDSERVLAENLSRIATTADSLRQRGIRLAIALIPEKADIYSELLVHPRPTAKLGLYDRVRARVAEATGTPVPDLRAALAAAKRSADVFYPTDTHWTVAGAGAVAHALAESLAEADGGATRFDLAPDAAAPHEGDLLRFVELGPFASLLPATVRDVQPLLAVAAAADADDFFAPAGDAAGETAVALVGTSYSAHKLWSFEPQLKAALGTEIVNYSKAGEGPFIPMQDFLALAPSATAYIRLVVWEIPLRYMDDRPVPAPSADSSST